MRRSRFRSGPRRRRSSGRIEMNLGGGLFDPTWRSKRMTAATIVRHMTSIPLAEELLLLAYDDQTGKATGSRIGLDLGMSAAVLVDLALAGRIAYRDGFLKVTDPTPIGDPIAAAI